MYFHLAVPGFHAAVHQAACTRLRDRPVAVATDAGDAAPLVAVSRQGVAEGLWAGMRAASARRRCPGLAVVTPEPDWYRRAQRALAGLCGAWTPRVGGRSGRLDGDLAGTERLWRGVAGEAPAQAAAIAGRLIAETGHRFHLDACCGVAERLGLARLAARAAQRPGHPRGGAVAIPAGGERALDAAPLRWIDGCGEAALERLGGCGVASLGQARALGADRLRELLGDDAAPITAVLDGEDEPVVPELADPEPEVAATRRAGEGGAGALAAARILAALAREVGFRLREQGLAATTLTIAARQLDGRSVTATWRARRQLRHDAELAEAAIALAARHARRVHWERFTLAATGLCAAEEQLELFAPPRPERLEQARDELRRRFGTDVVSLAG